MGQKRRATPSKVLRREQDPRGSASSKLLQLQAPHHMLQLTHHCAQCAERFSAVSEQGLPLHRANHHNLHRLCKHPDCCSVRCQATSRLASRCRSTKLRQTWLLFHNELKHQLALCRSKREDATEFLTNVKTQYDRLFELSPICSNGMITTVKKKIAAHATEEFCVPTYMNGFKHSEVYESSNEEF